MSLTAKRRHGHQARTPNAAVTSLVHDSPPTAKGVGRPFPKPTFGSDLALVLAKVHNDRMTIAGRVQGGVVVLERGSTLPDGTAVTVVPRQGAAIHVPKIRRRVVLPLVPSKHPGTLRLSAERIAELLEEDDLSSRR